MWCTAAEHSTHRPMAMQCPQGPPAHRPTRPTMCAAAISDSATLPCHGDGESPGRPAANLGPLSPCGMMHHAMGGTRARLRWPWLVRRDSGASTKTLDHAWNLPVPSPHPQNPRSQVANLAENEPKLGCTRGSRVWCTAAKHSTHRQMALQCPQGPPTHSPTRPTMCAAAISDSATLPCHGDGDESPGRPAANLGPLSPCGMMRHAIGGTHACLRWPWLVRGDPWASTDTL